jgi:hypothetical protein
MAVDGFSQRWKDFPDYIIGITKEIWEDRGIGTLNHYYSDDIVVRSPMGIQRGNQEVIASTMATVHEFPDRELFGEDVIWSGNAKDGFLSSHRIISTATHLNDGPFVFWQIALQKKTPSMMNGWCAIMAALFVNWEWT